MFRIEVGTYTASGYAPWGRREAMEAVVVAATGPHEVAARGHVVQFYRHSEELAEWAGGYLWAGVAEGGVAVTIATPEHRLAFEKRLAEAGVDVAAAAARGDYLALDAERIAHRLVTGGRLDRARFELVIGDLIHQATSAGQPVRVYGELVAVLWQAGRVAGAIELEEPWNGLGRRYPFGLWCGYPAMRAADRRLTDAVTEVCRHHSMVIGDVPVPPTT
jgi:hypothetical protein